MENQMKWPEMIATSIIGAVIVITGPMIYKYYAWLEYSVVGAAIGAGVVIIGLCLVGAGYGLARVGLDLAMRWQSFKLEQAKVYGVQAEAIAKLHMVTVIKPGHEAVISQIQHPALSAPVESSHYIAPPLAAKHMNFLDAPAVPAEALDYRRGSDWIREILFDDQGLTKAFHVKVDGPTGAGKTYLMLYLMWLIQQPHPQAEYHLIDPKFEGERSGWPFQPMVMDFDQAAVGAEYLYNHVVIGRKHAIRAGNPPQHPAFLIFDEADGCFDEHGDKFTQPVRRIIKEGRSGWTHCFMAGQSPLAKDVGFSGALFRNMARFVLGSEALGFVKNPQFTGLCHDKAYRDKLSAQLTYLQSIPGSRFALVIPCSGQGLPFVAEIPELELPDFTQRNLAKPKDLQDFVANYGMVVKKSDDAVKLEAALPLLKSMLPELKAKGKKIERSTVAEVAFKSAGGNQLKQTDAALLELGITLDELNQVK